MTISTDDINRYRGGLHAIPAVVVNRVPRIVAATARVNQTAFTYPLAQLVIDDLITVHTVKPGHMMMIGTAPGLWDVTVGVVKSISSGLIKFDAKSQGDPGYPRSIITPLANDQYITILKFRPAWGLLSSIRDGVFYKNWDIPYTGQGSNPDPVPVMGDWVQAFCPAGGSITLNLDASASWGWGARSIASFLWNLDGAAVNTGALTDGTLTADFEPGFYEVECQVVDTVGNARTGYRYYWINVNDPSDDNAPFNYRNPCSISKDSQTRIGREIGLDFGKNLTDLDDLFPGQAFLITENPTFDGEPLDGDSFVGSFVGYQTEGSKTTSYKVRQTTLTLKNPLLLAEGIPSATQELNETPNPSNWAECTAVLSNPVGAVWYIAAHHAPYLIDGHDFKRDNEVANLQSLRRQTFQFKSTNIGGQIKTVSDMALCFIGNRSAGRLRMVRNPNYFNTFDRNLMPVKWAFQPRDIAGTLVRMFNLRMDVSQVWGYAFGFDGSNSIPFQSLAPGYARSQADNQSSVTPFIVPMSGSGLVGQFRVNEITGHMYAEQNNRFTYSFNANRNLDFLEPIDADEWVTLTVSGSYDIEAIGWAAERAIPVSVNRTWEVKDGFTKKTVRHELQPESFGAPGITIPVDRGGANNWYLSDWNPGIIDIYQPIMPDVGLTAPAMLALNSYGLLAYSLTFADPAVQWRRLTVPAGTPVSFALDYNSSYFSNPETGSINFFVLTMESDRLHIYKLNAVETGAGYFEEMTGSPVLATVATAKAAKIKASVTTPGLVVAAWRDSDGTYFVRATDGLTFGAKTQVGATITGDETEPMGLDIGGDIIGVIAPNGGTTLDSKNAYGLFTANGAGAFSELTGHPDPDESAAPGFVTVREGTAYVSMIKAEPPPVPGDIGVITFDPGGNTDYVVSGAGLTTGGNPDNCAYNSFNANGIGGAVGVSVRATGLDARYNISDIEYDLKQEIIGGSIVGTVTETIKVECRAGGKLVGSGVPTFRENYGNGFLRYGITLAELKLTEPPDEVKVIYSYSFPGSTAFTVVYAYIDNVHITATPIDYNTTRVLYGVSVAIDSWDNRTPTGKQLALAPYALAADSQNANNLSMVGTSENGKTYLLDSTGGGVTWEILNRTPYAGVARSGDFVLGWGLNALGISSDGGLSYFNRLGNWAGAVGSIGEFLVVGGSF